MPSPPPGGGAKPPPVVSFAARYPRLAGRERERERGGGPGPPRGPAAAAAAEASRAARAAERGRQEREARERELTDRVEFAKLRAEVEEYGVGGLGAKDRRRVAEARVVKLGGRAATRARMGKRIGLGVAGKKQERERKAQEELRQTGMLATPKKPKKKGRRKDRGSPLAGVVKVKARPAGGGGRGNRLRR